MLINRILQKLYLLCITLFILNSLAKACPFESNWIFQPCIKLDPLCIISPDNQIGYLKKIYGLELTLLSVVSPALSQLSTSPNRFRIYGSKLNVILAVLLHN